MLNLIVTTLYWIFSIYFSLKEKHLQRFIDCQHVCVRHYRHLSLGAESVLTEVKLMGVIPGSGPHPQSPLRLRHPKANSLAASIVSWVADDPGDLWRTTVCSITATCTAPSTSLPNSSVPKSQHRTLSPHFLSEQDSNEMRNVGRGEDGRQIQGFKPRKTRSATTWVKITALRSWKRQDWLFHIFAFVVFYIFQILWFSFSEQIQKEM